MKPIDVPLFNRGHKILLLDSDILFFEKPTFLCSLMEESVLGYNYFNPDVQTSHSLSKEHALEFFGINLLERLNSGLALLRPECMRHDWYEEFLQSGALDTSIWVTEQTLLGLAACRDGARLMPEEYSIRLKGTLGTNPCRHYVGAIRHLMYEEGMSYLSKNDFFSKIRRFAALGQNCL